MMRHLCQCSSDHLGPNLKMWVHSAMKKVILNTHMELDKFDKFKVKMIHFSY